MQKALWMILALTLALGAIGCGDDDGGGSADTDTDTDTDTDSDTDTDTDTDTDADGGTEASLDVVVGDAGPVEIELGDLTTTSITTEEDGDFDVVLLSDILAEAGIASGDLADYTLDFEAGDGWNPEESGNCADVVPMGAEDADQGGVEPVSRNLHWDGALSFPGCMNVDDLAVIYAHAL